MYKASEFVEHKLSETMTFGPEGTAEVGCQDDVGKGEEWRVMGGRLRVRDIEYGGEVGSGVQDLRRGGLVDERAARGVDQCRARPQGVQQPCPDRAAGLGQEGRVETDDMAGGEQFLDADQPDAGLPGGLGGRDGIRGEDLDVEAAEVGRDETADVPEPQQADA